MSDPRLPKGYFPTDWTDWSLDYSWWNDYNKDNDDNKKKELTKSCTCGTNKTLGYEAPLEFHSDWCDLHDNSKTS